MKSVIVIGSGFAGLSAASFLARDGYDVTLVEKNEQLGGRARVWEHEGFSFDMGPSWYWMPDVFERYFKEFGYRIDQLYDLVRLDPSYKVIFGHEDFEDQSPSMEGLEAMFDRLDPGSRDLHFQTQSSRSQFFEAFKRVTITKSPPHPPKLFA